MMSSMIYMNLRCNDAADAFCKNIPVRRQMWEDILGIQFGLLGSGALCHEFNVGLMRLGVGFSKCPSYLAVCR